MIIWQLLFLTARREAPAAVCLHVCLRDHVQAIDIREAVYDRRVRIMAGPDRIYVMSLHDLDVMNDILPARGPACIAGKLMTVDTVEHYSPAVQLHDAVLHLKMPEARVLTGCLNDLSVLCSKGKPQLIQVRNLGAPCGHIRNLSADLSDGGGSLTAQHRIIFRK